MVGLWPRSATGGGGSGSVAVPASRNHPEPARWIGVFGPFAAFQTHYTVFNSTGGELFVRTTLVGGCLPMGGGASVQFFLFLAPGLIATVTEAEQDKIRRGQPGTDEPSEWERKIPDPRLAAWSAGVWPVGAPAVVGKGRTATWLGDLSDRRG